MVFIKVNNFKDNYSSLFMDDKNPTPSISSVDNLIIRCKNLRTLLKKRLNEKQQLNIEELNKGVNIKENEFVKEIKVFRDLTTGEKFYLPVVKSIPSKEQKMKETSKCPLTKCPIFKDVDLFKDQQIKKCPFLKDIDLSKSQQTKECPFSLIMKEQRNPHILNEDHSNDESLIYDILVKSIKEREELSKKMDELDERINEINEQIKEQERKKQNEEKKKQEKEREKLLDKLFDSSLKPSSVKEENKQDNLVKSIISNLSELSDLIQDEQKKHVSFSELEEKQEENAISKLYNLIIQKQKEINAQQTKCPYLNDTTEVPKKSELSCFTKAMDNISKETEIFVEDVSDISDSEESDC